MVAPNHTEDLKRKLRQAENLQACKRASNDYLSFIQLMHPHRTEFDDYTKTSYIVKKFHKIIADAMQKIESGEIRRLVITIPPRYGKTEEAAKKFIPFLMGRSPEKHVIYATYGLDLSKETGADIIHTMKSARYQDVFDVKLRKSGSAKDRVQTMEGGVGTFVGRGGAITGKGAHVLIIDDLIKDAEEANSASTMEKCWDWFNKVATTRLMDENSAIIIIMTRWSDNDIVGRILDPESPNYDPGEAAKWTVISMPALCEDPDDDPVGRKKGEALWPEKFSREYLEGIRRQDPRGFACLQQQNPTPDDGVYFSAESINEYRTGEEPKNLRIFAAADYAVATKQHNDSSCMIVAGVDPHENIWLLDCWWYKMPADKIVEAQLDLMRRWKPITWWMESGHISQSIKPFLWKRMEQEGVFCPIEEVTVMQDKESRAQSIKGYMSMGKVYFPRDKHWFASAISQILRFGGGARFDDFVDALSLLGMKLAQMRGGKNHEPKPKFNSNTFGAFKADINRQKRKRDLATAGAGM